MTNLCGGYSYPSDDIEEFADVWEEGRLRARKAHRCDECGGSIEPGQSYGRAKGLYDGTWQTFRRCPACMILAELVATLTRTCPLWDLLGQTIEDEGLDLPSPWEHRRQWDAQQELAADFIADTEAARAGRREARP